MSGNPLVQCSQESGRLSPFSFYGKKTVLRLRKGSESCHNEEKKLAEEMRMAVYCTQCGKELREDSAFCRFCGAKVRRLKKEEKRDVRFFTFAYMRDAASQAAALNRDGEWSY